MIKSSTGEVCSPNDDIKALDLHGTNALRARLLQIQADSGSGEEALLAETDIAVRADQAAQAEVEQAAADKIEQAAQALSGFRSYLAQSTGKAAQALPKDSELVYNYNPDTQKCEITRLDGEPIVLDISDSELNGELPLPPQLMVTSLSCSNNQLATLPELPASLTELDCRINQLTTLPELPANMTELYCYNNQLTTLPELPPSMAELVCRYNKLTTLPEVLPASLTELYCNSNQLTSLPELPPSLTELDCSNNPKLRNNPAAQAALQVLRDRGAVVSS